MMNPHPYQYVGLDQPPMRLAYDLAKALYGVRKWNMKACPVAVIALDGRILSWGFSGNGKHQIDGICGRLGRDGAPYSDCPWCEEEEHAERYALFSSRETVAGADVYLYGHHRMCESCIRSMRTAGIKRLFLLDNAATLFDHKHPESVIGKRGQFSI
jgi:deoxycytidylate deaminase